MRVSSLRMMGGTAAGLLLACGAQAVAAPAGKQDMALQELTEAAVKLRGRVETAIEKQSAPPMLSDPANGVLIEAAFNRDTLRALPADATVVKATCTPVMAAGLSYASYLAAGSRSGAKQSTDARVAELQDELALAFAAEDLCSKRLFEVTRAEHGSGSAAIANARQMQRGAIQLQTGMIMAQGDDTVKAANQALMLAALNEDPQAIVSGLTLAQRGDLRDRIDSVLADARPEAREDLQKLRAAYDSADCTGLCALTNVTPKAGPVMPGTSDGSAEPR